MSHHSEQDQARILDELKGLQTQLGETGEYPDGKLNADDEGEIAFAIGVVRGKVVMHFGKSVAWVGMTSEQARQLSDLLVLRADQLEKGVTVPLPDGI